MSDLRLLDEVSWRDTAVSGGRSHALLAALATAQGRAVSEDRLIEEIWAGDDPPANPAKALQVVVSRTRTQTDAEVVARADRGYRLGLPAAEVDALVLRAAVRDARAAEARGDLVAARDAARTALALPAPAGTGDGPLRELRRAARADRATASLVLGRALSGTGDHDEALALLEDAGADLDDEASTAALLRSLAAVRGAAAALERYEEHRADLADRLGVDPGPLLQAVHGELLAADNPVRAGVRFDATPLLGRDEDVRTLRALVRESRVVSILGPGGLGKTRLAHLLGREAEQSVVHFVELVGVSAPEDVVGEVGSALGVRDSVSGRRVLTPEQRRDVRARIAQSLERAPALLILDNCEHVVEAVADLVAYLVASVPRLHVVTTTRAPLAIAAERVFALGQLDEEAAAELFEQRARAARPTVALDISAEGPVRRVVRRLDGLPLAIELAAAKVRVMSVEDIDRRLDDRFALLRGGDRTAPDRHQTLVAVIDWSWNLLTESQRQALRWLSVFPDGFTLAAADEVLGRDALDDVQALADQSMLTVLDGPDGSVRYRMLETVREFGHMQLVGSGEDAAARAAQVRWAVGWSDRAFALLWGTDQIDVMREVLPEENNLADCLRSAVAGTDSLTAARLIAVLGAFWTIRGENTRVIALSSGVDVALRGWQPEPDQVDVGVTAAAILGMNTAMGEITPVKRCVEILEQYGAQARDERVRGLAEVILAQMAPGDDAPLEGLERIGEGHDPQTIAVAYMWAAHHRENAGDPERALEDATRGLAALRGEGAPWIEAMMHTIVAGLNAQLGKREDVVEHARAALPVLDALEATDDTVQIRGMLAYHALAVGDDDEAEALIEEIEHADLRRSAFGGAFILPAVRAELALARGRIEEGLDLYRSATSQIADLTFPGVGEPTGIEPWTLACESVAATAFALHGRGDEGHDIFDRLLAKAPRVLDPDRRHMDYPVAGLALHALGVWGVLRSALPPEVAVRLLVLAEQLAYPRLTPSLDPDRTASAAEEVAPGLAARARAEYGDRRGRDLLPDARAVIAQVTAPT